MEAERKEKSKANGSDQENGDWTEGGGAKRVRKRRKKINQKKKNNNYHKNKAIMIPEGFICNCQAGNL